MKEGFSVDLQADVVDGSDAGWDILEDVISKSIEPTQGQSQQEKGKIILCMYLQSQSCLTPASNRFMFIYQSDVLLLSIDLINLTN